MQEASVETTPNSILFLGGSLACQVSVASGKKKNVSSLFNIGATSGISYYRLNQKVAGMQLFGCRLP